MKCAHIFIIGDVSGVCFRAWTVRSANELGLTGWVRNADNKTVEAVFEADVEKVKEMIERCRKGPEVAWVEKLEIKWEVATGEFVIFQIRN